MDHLRCVIERITYQNPQNGYTVLKAAAKGYTELVTIVGTMPDTHVGSVLANVKHFFTLLGKMFFTSYGKEFFIYHGKQIFTSQGKHLFTRYGKQTLSSAQPCG